MLSPRAQKLIAGNASEFFQKVDEAVTPLVISQWQVPEDDIACSGVFFAYTRNEADVQIELRYTTGIDLYQLGETFDPTVKMQSELNDAVMHAVAPILAEYQIFCSVWCKPHANSKFTIGGSSD
jgi:hypothetical protein